MGRGAATAILPNEPVCPAVYEHGIDFGYFFVAMEYLDGENLSDLISRGPLPTERATAIAAEVCRFLEDAERFEANIGDRKLRSLLHGDLKPRNVRITEAGQIKVLDFGIAKALSLSRKVTRNDFGSVAYLSPERLETGDVDSYADFWAVGVLLHEMLNGAPPFQAPDTRRLEQLILSRRRPPSLPAGCPPAVRAVVAKLLGATPEVRYGSARAIREELDRVIAGTPTQAQAEGWAAARVDDDQATRRTRTSLEVDDEATRRTAKPEAVTTPTVPPPLPISAAGTPLAAAAAGTIAPPPVAASTAASAAMKTLPSAIVARPRKKRRLLRYAVAAIILALILNEMSVGSAASRLAAFVPTRELTDLADVWTEYERLAARSHLGFGTLRLERALTRQTATLAEAVIGNYRSPLPSVRELQWRQAREALARAVAVSPGDRELKAALRYCDGHLHRINGEARKSRGQGSAAQQEFTEAVAAFRESAELRPNWPDPFLGLARTFIYGLEDVDRAADALKQAQRHGYTPTQRETVQLADGYRARADALVRNARQLDGMPQERDSLSRAVNAYRQALTLYSDAVDYASVPRYIRLTQRSLEQVEHRIDEIDDASSKEPPPSGSDLPVLESAPITRVPRTLMSVSYVPAIDRDVNHARFLVRRLDARHGLLPLTSMVAILAIGLAYSGRTQSSGSSESAAAVNLNTVTSSGALEAPLARVFADQGDREFASRALWQFVERQRQDGPLPNVGAIARATVSVETIARTPSLIVYADRLRAARDRTARTGATAATTLPVFTPEDLMSVKPALTVRTASQFARTTMAYTAVYIAAFYLVLLLWWLRDMRGDALLLSAAHFLTAVGFALLLSRQDPLRDTMLLARYTEGVLLGLGVMAAVSLINFRRAAFLRFSYLPLLTALALSVLLMLFGSGPGRSTAKVNLGPVQPIEAIRLLLALFLAGYFARRWELLRQVHSDSVGQYRVPRWLPLPRLHYVLPVLAGVGAALLFFFLQKDLGPALFLSCVFLAMYAAARGRSGMAIAGFAVLVAGFYVGYALNISDTLVERIRMWQSPWDNGVRGGDQVAQSVWALATGGVFGTGLGFGDTRYLPAGHTDLVLAAIGEELGAAGLVALATLYALIAWRGFRIGLTAANDYAFFLATAVTLFLTVPTLVMAAGMLGLTPLTGVVTPFLSYGGSAMVANFAALGMLVSIRAQATSTESSEPFKKPARYLAGTLAAAGLVLIACILNVQLLRADDFVVKPHVSFQADGVRRYQYNPRMLDIVRSIPRGTIYDRSGLPLATGDAALMRTARNDYTKMGVAPNGTCAEPIERCYPLGGAAFHLLGDSLTRANWSATNSSYIERDAEDRLRGFDDHATAVESRDSAGRPVVAVRRDYRALVPFLRHRHDPHHPAVLAILNRKRDLHLTIDAELQLRVATILATAATKSTTGKAAAVVLDADTGELLAAASYPLPVLARYQNGSTPTESDAFLDRARYGLYPPGSTFKLVTAAAALRQDLAANGDTFTCSLLPDGRVGARIRGWARPVRDDVLDRHAHGTIDMHEAVVHSCNAYFAQLALRVGPKALLDTAARLGIAVSPSHSIERLRDTLPQAGYGQGDVVATPVRMARVAAAIAAGGVLRDVQVERGATTAKPDVLLPPLGAALLGGYMRDVVLEGTGRTLKSNPWRIAGKTGTAEVTGRPSHAWFVGFAPFGAAKKRIAVAVIVEEAGYGGLAAAPIAGEIVSAAAAAGLIH